MVLNLGFAIGTSMTFFWALHSILGENLNICGRNDLFFSLHLILGGNLDIRGRDDLFWTSADFFALHLMRNCIYMCLMTCNIGSG